MRTYKINVKFDQIENKAYDVQIRLTDKTNDLLNAVSYGTLEQNSQGDYVLYKDNDGVTYTDDLSETCKMITDEIINGANEDETVLNLVKEMYEE